MRDRLKTDAYWAPYIAECDRYIAKDKERTRMEGLTAQQHMSASMGWSHKTFEKFSALYSAGAGIDTLRQAFTEAIEGRCQYTAEVRRLAPKQPGQHFSPLQDYFFPFDERTRYLGLAILFEADAATVSELVAAVDMWHGKDAIWEKMIEHLGVHGRKPVTKVQWAQAFGNLWKCFTVPEEERPAQLKLFVDRWLKQMRSGDKPWATSHDSPHDLYFGYWCFEAAAVAKMLRIDDSALKDHPHYPYDLAHMPGR